MNRAAWVDWAAIAVITAAALAYITINLWGWL